MKSSSTLKVLAVLGNDPSSTRNSDPRSLHTVKDGYFQKFFGEEFSLGDSSHVQIVTPKRDLSKPCVKIRELFGSHGHITIEDFLAAFDNRILNQGTNVALICDKKETERLVTLYRCGTIVFITARMIMDDDLISTDCSLVVPKSTP